MKKIVIYLCMLIAFFNPVIACATDLNAAFGSLLNGGAVSVNKPGYYQSGARNSFVAGGAELRIPRERATPQLFSMTAPSITAGCGGISAHFGGFSFISGAEFEALLKSIASGAALGFVSMMVMKTLCPQCEAVVQFLKTMAQQAARLAQDSCRFGQSMAKSFLGDSGSDGTGSQTAQVCGATVSKSGWASDYLNGMEKLCTNTTSALDSILKTQPNQSPDGKRGAEALLASGNITWQRLTALDGEGSTDKTSSGYKRKLFLLNMLGADITLRASSETQPSCEVDKGDPLTPSEDAGKNAVFCPPRLSPEKAIGLFICGQFDSTSGIPKGSKSARVNAYCTRFLDQVNGGSVTKKIYTCVDPDMCNTMTLADPDLNLISGEGLVVQVNNMLTRGVDSVVNNTKLDDDVVKLINVAPYPLYQAINAAAVYPGAAADLLDSISILVAEQLVFHMFNEILTVGNSTTSSTQFKMSSSILMSMREVLRNLQSSSKDRKDAIGQELALQQMLIEQIRQVNISIQRQVMNEDMLHQNALAQEAAKAATPNVQAQPKQN